MLDRVFDQRLQDQPGYEDTEQIVGDIHLCPESFGEADRLDIQIEILQMHFF